jgi:hypothetical protein
MLGKFGFIATGVLPVSIFTQHSFLSRQFSQNIVPASYSVPKHGCNGYVGKSL